MIKRDIELHFPQAKRVLDIGMGHGRLVDLLRESNFDAWGIDIRNFGHEFCILANAKALPFADESFDVVVECYLLADLYQFQSASKADLIEVIVESQRVLKPGGGLIQATACTLARPYFSRDLHENGEIYIK